MGTPPRVMNRTGGRVSARAGTRTVSTTPRRPAWANVYKAYVTIDNAGKSESTDIEKTAAKYKLIGGPAEKEFNRAPNVYENACALRLSYALNHGGMPIKDNKQPSGGTSLKGADGNIYYTGIYTVRDFLALNWGKADKPYTLKVMSTKQQNSDLYDELTKFKKKGVVYMKVTGWRDAAGHVTLWTGSDFADGSDYLRDTRDFVIVTEFQFWELK